MSFVGQDISGDLDLKHQRALRDRRLVSEAQAGSPAAFAQIHSLYRAQLFNTAYAITKNREDAEDVIQDTFMRAHLALARFEGRSSVYSWLTRIAINSALMSLRKRRARPELLFEPAFETRDDSLPFEIKDTALNPEQLCDQRQRSDALLRAIKRLEPNLRTPIQIRMRHGSSLQEIGDALGISVAAVKTRLHRARARLASKRFPKRATSAKHMFLPQPAAQLSN